MVRYRILNAVLTALVSCGAASAQTLPATQDLKRLSLEELLNVEITVVTRQPEPARTAAAAVSVVTQEDIRRSGVTTLADALGLADGVNVARFNNGSWAITTRGFNGSTPNKLLVMVDGRNAFTPFFTGVFWNTLDYVLEDIDRIEVIRGSGATLWGANAVNGVVNIVTRHSRDSRGTFVSIGAGNEDPGPVDVRHGAGSDATSYRVYAKAALRADQRFSTGGSAADGRKRGQMGVRVDAVQSGNTWLFKADAFHGRDDFIDRRDGEWTEITAQAQLSRPLTPSSRLQVQSYFRREYRNIERQLTHHVNTGDLDIQYAFDARRHSFLGGGGVRINHDVTRPSAVLRFDPASRTYPVFSVFAQDEFAIRPAAVFVTAGVKVEHNAFSGADVQPNVRARWLLPKQQMLWSAVAKAVRRPTRFDDDIQVTTANGVVLIQGSDDFESEEMVGWDAGYRARPLNAVSLDVSVFAHRFGNLRSQDAPVAGVLPVTIGNSLIGRSRGVEMSATVQPGERWRVHASYTRLHTTISKRAGSRDVSGGANEANDPDHLFSARAGFDLAHNLDRDVWWRGIGALPNPAVPGYSELNARLGWRVSPRFELSLVGQDLLHDAHPEFGTAVPRRIEFERSVRAMLAVRLPQ